MCPHTMRLLQYILAKLNAMPSLPNARWLGLRISYGMNGIVLKSEDLKALAKYMRYAFSNVLKYEAVHVTSSFPEIYPLCSNVRKVVHL